MKLNPQQKAVYDYLVAHNEATIVELRNALFIAKPCMRISEINRLAKAETDKDLIVTKYKKANGEHVKALTRRLTKTLSSFQYDPERNCMVEVKSEVNV
jgi:integrase